MVPIVQVSMLSYKWLVRYLNKSGNKLAVFKGALDYDLQSPSRGKDPGVWSNDGNANPTFQIHMNSERWLLKYTLLEKL